MSARAASLALCATLLACACGVASADETCTDFKWDVTKERALFAHAGTPLAAGVDAKSAPSVALDHLYTLSLAGQDQVTFAVKPRSKIPAAGAYAGLVSFMIPAAGRYRVSIDMPFWIDVIADGALLSAQDYQGQRGCSSPHKIVEFDLQGMRPFLLQLSSAGTGSVQLTVTASPVRKF